MQLWIGLATGMHTDRILESRETPERLVELSRLAEDNGLDGVWVRPERRVPGVHEYRY